MVAKASRGFTTPGIKVEWLRLASPVALEVRIEMAPTES